MKKKAWVIFLAAVLVLGASIIHFFGTTGADRRESIVIAIPHGEFIRNMDTNYYKLWLEQQTGLSISFVYLEDGYTAEYLDNAFASGDVTVDGFFSLDLGGNYQTELSMLENFGEKGYILPVNSYIDGSTNLDRIFDQFGSYDLRRMMSTKDGNIYFMPGLDASRSQSTGDVLWLNKRWLSALRLSVPQTTEHLYEVLEAFQTEDPNSNGLADEIPLCGTLEAEGQQLYHTLINAFVYCDPDNSYLLVQDGEVMFAPVTDGWRDAMKYLNRLYADGLIAPMLFEIGSRSFSELANSPLDLLGGFTAGHITDVLLQNSPEILSSFIQVAPLIGPDGVRNTTAELPIPRVAGVITASCENPRAVFELFDLMLSEEAFLIGRYGEENVDWEKASVTDLDFYGGHAEIRIINHLVNKMQNKHLSEFGPFYAYPQYADSVCYGGLEADQEYINARAVQAYEPYLPEEALGATLYLAAATSELQEIRIALDAYTQECIHGFMTGALDPYDDAVWQRALEGYRARDLAEMIDIAQASYDMQEVRD